MTVVLTAEQRELRSVARDFFTDRSGESRVRQQMADPTGADTDTWKQLTEQLGVQGMVVPEAYGGGGFSRVDLGVVLEEAGRALYGGPLLSTVLAAEAVMAAGDDAASAELLPRPADGGGGRLAAPGRRRGPADGAVGGSAALQRPGGGASRKLVRLAEQQGLAGSLTGRKLLVLDG